MKKNFKIFIMVLLVAVTGCVFAACGNRADNVEIELNKSAIVLFVGESVRLEAVVSGSDEAVKWESEDADIADAPNGFVTGISEGTTKIAAIVGDTRAECTVTVSNNVEFTVLGQTAVYVGHSIDLAARLTVNGLSVEIDDVEFSLLLGSENATISGGTISGIAAGTAKIKAVSSSFSGTAEHTIEVLPVVDIAFASETEIFTTTNFTNNHTYQLTAQANSNGAAADINAISYKSLTPEVATVSESGLVSFVKAGEALIEASYGGATANCTVICRDFTGYTAIANETALSNIEADGKFYLTNDIDLGGKTIAGIRGETGLNGSFSGTFTGVFDGNGFAIKNFSIGASGWNRGLFGVISGGTVRNLTLECATFAVGPDSGVLSYGINNGSMVENVYISVGKIVSTALGNNQYSGVFAANINKSKVVNCAESVSEWQGEGDSHFTRIARVQTINGSELSGNYSIINNAPSGISKHARTTVLSAEFDDIEVYPQKSVLLSENRLAGYNLSFELEGSIATLDGLIITGGITTGETYLIAAINGLSFNGIVPKIKVKVNIFDTNTVRGIDYNGTVVSWKAVPIAEAYNVKVYDGTTIKTKLVKSANVNIKSSDFFTTLVGDKTYTISVSPIVDGQTGDTPATLSINTVANLTQFKLMGKTENVGKNYLMINDIDCGGADLRLALRGNGDGTGALTDFSGVLDGNGKKLFNCNKKGGTAGDYSYSMIAILSGEIRNLSIIMDELTVGGSEGGSAALVTEIKPTGKITNCYLYVDRVDQVIGKSGKGLFAALNNGIITDCVVVANFVYFEGNAIKDVTEAAIEAEIKAEIKVAIEVAMEDIPEGATEAAIKAAIDAAIEAAMEGTTEAEIKAAINAAIKGIPEGATEAEIKAVIEAAMKGELKGATEAEIEAAIEAAIKGIMEGATEAEIEVAIKAAIKAAIEAAIEAVIENSKKDLRNFRVMGYMGDSFNKIYNTGNIVIINYRTNFFRGEINTDAINIIEQSGATVIFTQIASSAASGGIVDSRLSLSLVVGATYDLKTAIRDIANYSFEFSVVNSNIATVSDGVLTGKAAGTTELRIKVKTSSGEYISANGNTAEFTIKIRVS